MRNKASLIFYYKKDSQDRENNLSAVLSYYSKHAPGIEIQILEEGLEPTLKLNGIPSIKYTFWKETGKYRRTEAFNEMTKTTTKEVLVFHDVDVFAHPSSLAMSIAECATNGNICLPYNGTVVNVAKPYHSRIVNGDPNSLGALVPPTSTGLLYSNPMYTVLGRYSVGGIVCMHRNAYNIVGGYNPNFKGWGFEDNELVARSNILGVTVRRKYDSHLPVLIHLDHVRTEGTSKDHTENEKILAAVKAMSKEEIQNYIKTWSVG